MYWVLILVGLQTFSISAMELSRFKRGTYDEIENDNSDFTELEPPRALAYTSEGKFR